MNVDVWQVVLSFASDVHDALLLRAVCKEGRAAFRHVPCTVSWREFSILPALLHLSPRADHALVGPRYGTQRLHELCGHVIHRDDTAILIDLRWCWNDEGRAMIACALTCRQMLAEGRYVRAVDTTGHMSRDSMDALILSDDTLIRMG